MATVGKTESLRRMEEGWGFFFFLGGVLQYPSFVCGLNPFGEVKVQDIA